MLCIYTVFGRGWIAPFKSKNAILGDIMRLYIISLVTLLVGVLSACATIVDGNTEHITLTSEPEGATVIFDGKVIGKTPLTTVVKDSSNPTLSFELDGYQSFTTTFDSSINPIFLGNLIIGGVFGTTTDAASGALYKYDETSYYAELLPVEGKGLSVKPKRAVLKSFVLMNAISIRELASESLVMLELKDLFDMLGVREGMRSDNCRVISKLSELSEDDAEFAEAIADHYEV